MAAYPALPPADVAPPVGVVASDRKGIRQELSRRSLLYGSAAILASGPFLLTGCDGGDKPGGKPGRSLDEVTYVTAMGTTGREAFAWVADAKGFFKAEGLKVKIEPGAAGDANLKILAAGKAQFVQTDYASALVRAGAGTLGKSRVISVLTPKTLIALMVLQSSGITSPKDLVGKRLAQTQGSVVKTLFPAYARLGGLDQAQISTVTWHEVSRDALPPLLMAGQADGIAQFVPGMPGIAKANRGQPITVLPYSQYMTDLYGNVVLAQTDTDVDVKRRFARALHKGLQYAAAHLDEAGEILHQAVPTMAPDVVAAEMKLLQPYVGATPAGTSTAVARSIALMQSVGMYPTLASALPEQVFDFDVLGDASKAANGGTAQ